MKKLNTLYIAVSTALLFASCSDFLDTVPDNRTELKTEAKITSLLVSAYPDCGATLMTEISSDNVKDNGALYGAYNQEQEESYLWMDIISVGNDSPKFLWNKHYIAIASANQALEAIEEMGNPASLNAQRGEALICRAFAHFILANVFCEAYNPQTAETQLGIPYSMKPETQVKPQYERGNLADVYAKINQDIEEALPLIDDNLYTVPKYHFNKKAAYAFAARFNLFYVQPDKSNYEKVIKYANLVLGTDPMKVLRTWDADFGKLSDYDDVGNVYTSAKAPANLLILPIASTWPYVYGAYGTGERYAHAKEICDTETSRSKGLWASGTLVISDFIWNPQEKMPFPKMTPHMEYTDKVNQIGILHAVTVPFTTDETLLCRAEAHVMKAAPDYASATQDINYWIASHSVAGANRVPFTQEQISTYYETLHYAPIPLVEAVDRSVKKQLNPAGFTVSKGIQEDFIHCVLHLRRIETLHEGLRWYDVKRFGIEITHNLEGAAPDVLKVNDPRRAIQLPQDVIAAGLQANPRN